MGTEAQPGESSMDSWVQQAVNGTADFIREIGIYRLGSNEGCPCTSFEVQNVHVDVSCHKSEQTVRVWTNHADYCDARYRQIDAAMQIIADEVLRQVDAYYDAGGEYAAGFEVKFCSWEQENRSPNSNATGDD